MLILVHKYNTQEASWEAINPLGPIVLVSIMDFQVHNVTSGYVSVER